MRKRPALPALVSGVALVLIALVAAGCSLVDQSSAGQTIPAPVQILRTFRDEDLASVLLPKRDVPEGMSLAEERLTSNDYVASLFRASALTMGSVTEAGRMNGAVAHYQRDGALDPTSDQVVEVSSSMSWYRTVPGAQAVLRDPSTEAVIHELGLLTSEVPKQRIGDESRVFRGYRERDGPNLAAYMVLFRRQNMIGALVVIMPNTTDDGGRLALLLARRQASLPLPAPVAR